MDNERPDLTNTNILAEIYFEEYRRYRAFCVKNDFVLRVPFETYFAHLKEPFGELYRAILRCPKNDMEGGIWKFLDPTNRAETEYSMNLHTHTIPNTPTILVVFGATGDLMTKKIAPALPGRGFMCRRSWIFGGQNL